MNYYGPLLITFGFFTVLFVIGKLLQHDERKKRMTTSEAQREKAGP
jgi:hypothetical protein